jgi:ribosomal 50S subunit-recycling heat shock protein
MQLKQVMAGLGIGVVMLAAATGLMAAEAKSGQPTVKRARVVTLTATVEAIDLTKRLVTLKGPRGKVVTVTVDERVKNLPQVQVGDQVVVKYYESIALRVLPPGEATPSASATGAVATAQPGQKPAGVGAHEVTVTVTVEAIDRKASTVTFKGPEGNSVTVKAQDPKNLEKVKVGDKVEITYIEALGISVEKAKKKS